MAKKELTYDAALSELQSIVEDMQEELINVDDLEKKTKRAAYLIDWCRDKLRATEKNIGNLFE